MELTNEQKGVIMMSHWSLPFAQSDICVNVLQLAFVLLIYGQNMFYEAPVTKINELIFESKGTTVQKSNLIPSSCSWAF